MTDGVSGLLEKLREALAPEYEVERVLGTGGMGAVFLARDRRLDRLVAVKVVSPELAASEALRQRFLREARTIARLRHSSIVDVYTAGESNGLLYFIMQYVPGESLRDVLDREKRIPPARAAVILCDLAGALAYAHAQGVVHRDIKPENVLIDTRTGTAHLTDFGVARAFEAADDRMTGTGLIVGSPRYMSPEQAAGERELDGRSDIYSLGLIGYEMLTGAPTFSGASPVSVIAKQITEIPPPVATRADGVPPALANVIDRALAKDPNERWPDASAMTAALGDVVHGRAGVPAAAAAAPPGRTRRRNAIVAGVAALVIAGGIWVARTIAEAPSGFDRRKSILVTPFDVQGDPALAWLREGSVNMLTLNLASWSDLTVVDYDRSIDLLRDRDLDAASRIGLEDAREMARDAGVWTVVLGQVGRVGDSLMVVARAYDVESGKRVGEPARHTAPRDADPRMIFDAVARDLLDLAGAPPMRPELAQSTTSSLEAYRAYLFGLQALNRWQLDEADSAFRRATEADSTFALAYYKRSLARGWNRTVSDTSDVRLARAAARHATRLPQRERSLIESYLQLSQGLAAQSQANFEAGSAHLTAAERGYEAILARDSTDAEAWYGLADAYFHHGGAGTQLDPELGRKWTRALRAFNRTLALDSTFHLAYAHKLSLYQIGGTAGQPIIVVGDSVILLANDSVARAVGAQRVQTAREQAREMAVLQAKHWRYLDPDATQAHTAVVDGYSAAGHYDSAATALRQTMERPDIRTADMAYVLASLEMMAGAPDALTTLRTALDTYGLDSLLAAGGTRRLQSLAGAANVAAFYGALPEYERLLALVARVEPRLPGTNIPMRSITMMWRTMARLSLGMDSPQLRRSLDSSFAAIDRLSKTAPGIQSQARGLAVLAFLTTRDTAYVAPLRRWGTGRVPPEVEALLALEAGDSARAARIAAGFTPPDSVRLVTDAGAGLGRFAQAEIFARLGDLRRAAALYESIERKDLGLSFGTDPRWPLYARSFLARGQLYEQVGDRQRATAAYEEFLRIWKDASPELRDQLRLAREGIIRLRDAPATKVP